uniref:Uncharacterized protein n=1 Tax=Panagrolaimus superbus TaxID=310955 RepID=A0A914YGW0_9BILA
MKFGKNILNIFPRLQQLFSETDTTATITTVTTKKPLHIFKETTTTTLATTTTLLSTVNEKVTETATGKDGNAINSDKSSSDGSKNYIIPVVCAILCLIIIAAVIYFIHRYCLKKRSTVKAVKSDTTLPQNDVTKTPTTNLKTTPTKTPPTPTNPMAPEHLAAETFAYKGPLVLQTKPPTEVPLVSSLFNFDYMYLFIYYNIFLGP